MKRTIIGDEGARYAYYRKVDSSYVIKDSIASESSAFWDAPVYKSLLFFRHASDFEYSPIVALNCDSEPGKEIFVGICGPSYIATRIFKIEKGKIINLGEVPVFVHLLN